MLLLLLLALVVLALTAAGNTQPAFAATARWEWPIAEPHTVVAPWQAPANDYSAGHRGIDIAAAPGDAVYAAESGIVHFVGTVVDRPLVSIDHGGGYLSSIEPVTSTLSKGDLVAKGQQIGVVATGGHCSTDCAHFGVRKDEVYISPMMMLGKPPWAILLPL